MKTQRLYSWLPVPVPSREVAQQSARTALRFKKAVVSGVQATVFVVLLTVAAVPLFLLALLVPDEESAS
ncbi:hypothetical protein JJD41_00120 [Oxynema sp. CENA135]|uniref:hypothetical protein n=1 Tax=Oxynema sp. CENA135 TaxID=984206 RepID=UPI00190D45DD|nr:hypothetical protein [Oxynema sp. CENA135]MBK4728301.1 hypothetical protein [Oxynema sp. CENA135]